MLPSGFEIAIRSSLGVWTDVTASVQALTDGTSSESQVVPEISLTFAADTEALGALLDPEIDPHLARIRVTNGADIRYYLLEDHSGNVKGNYRYPNVTGRAYAGRVVDWPRLTYVWDNDALCSTIAQQCCQLSPATGSGEVVPVQWQATQNPAIPGGVYEVSRKGRLEILQELAEMCGARVRASADGLGFEILDVLDQALTGTALRTYANPLTLSYRKERCHIPYNAVRVKGERPDYSGGQLPSIKLSVLPATLPANGTSTAIALAQVFDAQGRPVAHTQVIDEPIDAGSYTTIPVSGCYAVLAVWLNTGTQQSPVKGARITPTTFTASAITVPTQATDLFIVSYVQAESVSWSLSDYADSIESEAQNSTGALEVQTTYNAGAIRGVYRASDVRKVGTNFYTGGSHTANTKIVTLGISPGATGTALLVDYDKYNGSPLAASISPASSLCDADGLAQTTIGSGTTAGLAVVTASSQGVEAAAQLSLVGAGVGSVIASATPAKIRKLVTETRVIARYTNEPVVVKLGADINGRNIYYIDVDHQIEGIFEINIGGSAAFAMYWQNDAATSTWRIFLNGSFIPDTAGNVNYDGVTLLDEASDTATIAATVTTSAGAPATDGTAVTFRIVSGAELGATLSAASATTSDGVAQVTLTAGSSTGNVTVRAASGGYWSDVVVEIVESDISSQQAGSRSGKSSSGSFDAPDGFETGGCSGTADAVANDSNSADGYVTGQRRLVDCDGKPIPNEYVTLWDGSMRLTDANGVFSFTTASAGSNPIWVRGEEYAVEVAPLDSAGRGGMRFECRQ